MRHVLLTIFVYLIASTSLMAQDTLMVEAEYDDQGFPVADVIYDKVVADTNDAGEQLHDVYMLEAGEGYTLRTPLTIDNELTLTAPKLDRLGDTKPPVVRVEFNEDGSSPTGGDFIFFYAGADIEISNIYFSGIHTQNGWTSGNFLRPTTKDINIHLRNLIIDYMGWSILTNVDPSISGVSYISENVYIKNAQNTGDMHSPFYLLNVAPVDSFINRNVTYFQSHGYFMNSKVPMDYVEINHCTFANELKLPLLNTQYTNAKINNNIFYNASASGYTESALAEQDRDGLPYGIVNVDTVYNEDSTQVVTDRHIEVKNNVYFESEEVTNFLADSLISTGGWMNSRTQAFFEDDETYPNLIAQNNVEMDPEFANITEPGDNGENAVAEMMTFVSAVRSGDSENAGFWGYEGDLNQEELSEQLVEWPLTEDLSHNITSVTDSQGNEVGDLSWFGKTVDIEDQTRQDLPNTFALEQNFPNPFNPTTNLQFTIGHATNVTLEVYNTLGQKVATLLQNERLSAGRYVETFNGSNLSSGLYIYKLQTSSNYVETKKMMLLK